MIPTRILRAVHSAAAAGAILLLAAAGASAQERDSIPGVTLGLVYETSFQPALAIRAFEGRFGGESDADQVEAIIARDLRYSDRFEIIDSLPPAMMAGETIDYPLWDRLGAVWLLTGQLEGEGDHYALVVQLHDVVYGRMKESGRYPVPNPADPDFRMAVHRVSDEVVRWVFNEPGMAASRIAFSMPAPGSNDKELYVVDADGENLRRVTSHNSIVMSPSWSPDGARIAFSAFNGGWRVYVRDLASGAERMVTDRALQTGEHMTPAFSPDGATLAFAVTSGERSGIYTYNIQRNCCLSFLTGGRWNDISPVYSPDGRTIAFNSNRLGTAIPQVYVMPAGGGEPDLISPYAFDRPGYFTSPSFSPLGGMVAFHGAIRRGQYHILVARIEDRGQRVKQLTWEGNNEDPTWAPDGRHLAFKGERRYGKGLFVVDVTTGQIRTIVNGIEVTAPEWSPPLGGR